MRQIVEQYPESEVSEMAGQIVKGVQQGRRLVGSRMTADDIWRQRQNLENPNDSTAMDTLSTVRDTRYTFILAYSPDSVNQNQLLYDIAKYNFTSYLVRNFDINIDTDGAYQPYDGQRFPQLRRGFAICPPAVCQHTDESAACRLPTHHHQ